MSKSCLNFNISSATLNVILLKVNFGKYYNPLKLILCNATIITGVDATHNPVYALSLILLFC